MSSKEYEGKSRYLGKCATQKYCVYLYGERTYSMEYVNIRKDRATSRFYIRSRMLTVE